MESTNPGRRPGVCLFPHITPSPANLSAVGSDTQTANCVKAPYPRSSAAHIAPYTLLTSHFSLLTSHSKHRLPQTSPRRLPDLDDLVDDHGGEGDRKPHTHRFDG